MVWRPALIGGIVAALLATPLGEILRGTFPPASTMAMINGQPTPEISKPAQAEADRKDATLVFGLMAAILAASLGTAGAWASGQKTARLPAVGLGVLLGTAGTAAACWLLAHRFLDYEYWAEDNQGENLLFPLLIHAGMWALAGAGGGAALAWGLGGGRIVGSGFLGGLAGAVLGATLYEVIGAVVFPTAKTSQAFAVEWLPRALAISLVCLMSAVCSAVAITDSGRKGRSPGPSR